LILTLQRKNRRNIAQVAWKTANFAILLIDFLLFFADTLFGGTIFLSGSSICSFVIELGFRLFSILTFLF
jgi:hypothetical protein